MRRARALVLTLSDMMSKSALPSGHALRFPGSWHNQQSIGRRLALTQEGEKTSSY
ncbi:hypothetical protein IE4771_CH03922 [Rhizobium etli bv. mimosae str. IE4771]|uniref:Uncharacterized protein n=1 Tax=Rhizobium etli bv. mimosae str. IE4771 TaxID=1432050 RepID=A0A060IAA0_RHIET|nr:hypothetical protein IE4771_CH03922 [Rhizobium sp. IE4771]